MFSLPLLLPWHQLPLPSFHSEWLAFVLGLLVLIALLARAGSVVRLPAIALAPALLGLVVLLQLALGQVGHPANALVAAGFLLWSTMLAIGGASAARQGGPALLASLAWGLLGGSMVNAAVGLIQFAGLDTSIGALVFPAPARDRYGMLGNLAQANHFATHLALGMAALLWLRENARIGRVPGSAAFLLLLAALALSGSRSGLLYIAWLGALWCIARGRPKRVAWLALLLVATVAALWLAARASLLGPQLARLVLFSEGAGPRAYFWGHALEMGYRHPLLGVGIDGFAQALVSQLQAGERVWEIDQYAHNLLLQLLAVTGLTGLAALALPGALFVRRLWRAPRDASALWPWGVLGILFIHSMLEQPLYYAYFLGIASHVAGAADPCHWSPLPQRRLRTALLTIAAAAVAPLALAARDFPVLQGAFYAAEGLNPAQLALLRRVQLGSPLAPYAELLAPGQFSGPSASQQLTFNTRLMGFAPTAEVLFRQALLLAALGQQQAARQQWVRAARAYPGQAAQYSAHAVAAAPQGIEMGKLAVFAIELGQGAPAPASASASFKP